MKSLFISTGALTETRLRSSWRPPQRNTLTLLPKYQSRPPRKVRTPMKKKKYIIGARRFCFLLNSSRLIPLTVGEDMAMGKVYVVRVRVLLAHEGLMAGHLGVHKTRARLRGNFWWPGMAGDIMEWVKDCHTCQMVGKHNRIPPIVPLYHIPTVDPFTRIQNQLVLGHRVRGPLDLVREAWCAPYSDRPESLLKSMLRTRERLVKALEVAPHHLGAAPKKRRRYYDQKVKYCNFAPGEETTEVPGSELVVPAGKVSG